MCLSRQTKSSKRQTAGISGAIFSFSFLISTEREIERFVDCARDLFTYFFSKFNRSKKKAFYIVTEIYGGFIIVIYMLLLLYCYYYIVHIFVEKSEFCN